jgi:hypothetical protein
LEVVALVALVPLEQAGLLILEAAEAALEMR